MSHLFIAVLAGILSVTLTGCVTVKKVVRERVDQDISGNQGYISGKGPSPERIKAKDREYIDIKVEVPTWEELSRNLPKRKPPQERPIEDKEITGNRGYIMQGRSFDESLPPIAKPPVPKSVSKPTQGRFASIPAEPEVSPGAVEEDIAALQEPRRIVPPRTYKVKEGDSLSQIAKDFYGRASKWTIIYEANSDKIKDPSRIKVGTILEIPDLEEAETGYIK